MTAALEIPLSIISAFIMMKLFNVNINLISLGGLALAAGMNVDASVVVLENIFRKVQLFKDKKPGHQYSMGEIVAIVTEAVREVAIPIMVSMLTSLIVFIPLILTQDLTNAILSDLGPKVRMT